MMHQTQLILDQLAFIKIESTLWSGRKQLRPEDLILGDGSRLPPRDLASLGSKRIADPRDIQVFARLKKEGERCCLKVGSRFLGGYAVPETRLDDVTLQLDRIRDQFEASRFDFLSRYDQAVEDWANQHPDFRDAIRRSVDPVSKVARLLSFDHVVFRMRLPDSPGSSLERRIGGLTDLLMTEVAQEARVFEAESLTGKDSVTRRVMAPFRRIRDKLEGMAFIDKAIRRWVDEIDEVLDRLPRRGDIRGSYLQELKRIAHRLGQAENPDSVTESPAPWGVSGCHIPELSNRKDDFWNSNEPGIVRNAPLPESVPPQGSFWF